MANAIDYLEIWYSALRAQIGYAVECGESDPALVRQKLYMARRTADDPALEALFITLSPSNPQQLWVMHKRIALDAESE